jgi:hypothetical protein
VIQPASCDFSSRSFLRERATIPQPGIGRKSGFGRPDKHKRSRRAVTEEPMRCRVCLALCLACLAAPPALHAQGTSRPTTSDSRDGYIDDAIPGDQVRLRFDASYNDNRPNRAEFFWPQGGVHGPGLPLPEARVDYQDLSAYLELLATGRLSGFVEVPWRFVNPEINANHNGLSDMNAGFKYALIDDSDIVATFQFRTYIPTGNGHLGLGTEHVSLEPALLLWSALGEGFGLEAELRYWASVGGTDFAGDILRYGVGVHYDLPRWGGVLLSPTLTFVGWTVVSGKESVLRPTGVATVDDAAGETIVNVKIGVRAQSEHCGDLFVGYGHALTGDRWYADTVRVEWRLAF